METRAHRQQITCPGSQSWDLNLSHLDSRSRTQDRQIRQEGFRVKWMWRWIPVLPVPAVSPRANLLTYLSISFLICKMGLLSPITYCCHRDCCAQSRLILCNPMDCSSWGAHRLLGPWNFPGKNTVVDCHFLLLGIFLTQGSNLRLLHLLYWQADSLPLHHLGRLIEIATTRVIAVVSGTGMPVELHAKCLSHYIVIVQSLSRVRLFSTPWIAACQASLSITNSWSSLKLMSIESVMPSSHLILCHPLLLLPLIPPSLRVFSSELALRIRWPEYRSSASVSVLPMNTQDWSPLGWSGWFSLQSKGLSRVFSNTTVQKHQYHVTNERPI